MGDGIDGGTGGSFDLGPLLEDINEAKANGDEAQVAANLAVLDTLTSGGVTEE